MTRLAARTGLVALIAALAVWGALGAPPASAGGYRFYAGAARVETTPPRAGTPGAAKADAAFAPLFAACSGAFPARGRFALQEPFADLNGDGQWDAGTDLNNGPNGKKPDPFCDANGNGRWDGIYADNGKGPATGVHDPIDVRAVAISDGRHPPVVFASVDQIGLFDFYTDEARQDLLRTYHVQANLVVSADHNESSPDSIGLYGSFQTPLGVGVRSGIDEYYMSYLDDRVAAASAAAVRSLKPAQLYANQVSGPVPAGQQGHGYPLLKRMSERISDQFPTSVALPRDDRVAAVDTKMGVLQARDARSRPIFTVVSLAAHNQEMGNSGAGISGDWPGAMERALDSRFSGVGMFLVGDNGSEEDPQTTPPVIPNGSENHSNQATQYRQVVATGTRFADIAAASARSGVKLEPGAVALTRIQFCIPLENNGFVTLAAAGEFGRRQGYTCDSTGRPVAPIPNGSITPTTSAQFRTFVSYADIGPDLQLLDNPGEAFPALMLGSPFGVEEESCNLPNPAVPTWHARALYRFQVGLADDLIGYLIPAWGFASGTPGLFSGATCTDDMHGHHHKLESESAGPTSANDVANRLAGLLSHEPDRSAHVVLGRFVRPDGTYSRWATGAAGVLVAAPRSARLDPRRSLLIAAPAVRGFGARKPDLHGLFMDYDGQPQPAPDITTRGIMVLDRRGCVAARYYLNVFPTLTADRPLGGIRRGSTRMPWRRCAALHIGSVPEIQPGAAASLGLAGGRLRH